MFTTMLAAVFLLKTTLIYLVLGDRVLLCRNSLLDPAGFKLKDPLAASFPSAEIKVFTTSAWLLI